MAGPLRFGIMGTGNIASQFAHDTASARRGVVTAVGSRTGDAAKDFADRFNIPHHHGTYDALLADDEVDAIYLTLPNSMHHEWTLRALRAGKHVLCEKPFAVTSAEAEQMFAVAGEHGRVLVEAFMYRSHPQTVAVLEHIRAGVIGKVRLIRVSFCYSTSKIDGNIRFSSELAGGALMDIGCYCTDFVRLIADAEPDRVTAVGKLHGNGVDEYAAGALGFPNGIVATFACGMTVQTDNAAMICGSDGYIRIPIPWKPVTGGHFSIEGMTPPRQDANKSRPPDAEIIRLDVDSPLYALEADHFVDTVLDRRPPAVTREQTLGNVRLLEQLRAQVGLKF